MLVDQSKTFLPWLAVWPKHVDCRPIYLEKALCEAGYIVQKSETDKLLLLPLEIVVAIKNAMNSSRGSI